MIGRALDAFLGVFSPKTQLARMTARELIESKRLYAAARPGMGGVGFVTVAVCTAYCPAPMMVAWV